MAKTRTLTAEVEGKVYTKKTPRAYRYFWICDIIRPSGQVMKDAAQGWSCKPVNKDGKYTSWSDTCIYANTRCVPLASDQGETTVEKEKETDAAVIERVLPRDIDKLCPYIGEPARVDADGDGPFKIMELASITPHYLTFRWGSRQSLGWTEVKVSRRWGGLGSAFVLWRDEKGWLHCQLVEVEA